MLSPENRSDEHVPPPKGYTRKLVSLPPELAERVTDYRFRHRLASETAAIRLLLEKALDADEREDQGKPAPNPKP